MSRQNIPSYRLHKTTGQAIVVPQGKLFYLGQCKNKASWKKCDVLIAEYLANDSKLPPTRIKDELTIEDASILFLKYAEGYYCHVKLRNWDMHAWRNLIC